VRELQKKINNRLVKTNNIDKVATLLVGLWVTFTIKFVSKKMRHTIKLEDKLNKKNWS